MPSFSVRHFFRWVSRPDQTARNLYEERITIWKAESIDEALSLAKSEATAYAADGEKDLGLSQAYELDESVDATGVEVFSLLRESDLEPDDYVRTFFLTGKERTQ